MSVILTLKFFVYIIVMVIKLCHSIDHFEGTIKINNDPSGIHTGIKSLTTSFFHQSYENFTIFHFLKSDQETLIYVVSDNDTIIEISYHDMKLLGIRKNPFCADIPKYHCDEAININLLSEVKLFERKMIWFCYIPQITNFHSPMTSHCILPKNTVVPVEIRWTKAGFTSTSHTQGTFAVQTETNIFIGSSQLNSLMILRTKLPENDGKINSGLDLVTPMAEFYFEKNSRFLEGFATKYEVYFVVQEPILALTSGVSECVSSPDAKKVIQTRLIKMCKDDPGGTFTPEDRNFGTAAKAEIICPVGLGAEVYQYTRSISASWSGDKLYVLFDSQINAPSGKVICVYDKLAFNTAFNSDMMPPKIFSSIEKIIPKVSQPMPDLCRRLTLELLTDKEKEEASTMSITGLYRSKHILPINKAPLIRIGNLDFDTISTFTSTKLDPVTVIVMSENNSMRILLHLEGDNICHVRDFRLQPKEVINTIKGDNMNGKVLLFASTNQRMLKLDLGDCDSYEEKSTCIRDAPSICGWDFRQSRCTIITEYVDIGSWERSRCKNYVRIDDKWSLPEQCDVKDKRETLRCSCKYCLDESGCGDGERVLFTNCIAVKPTDTPDVYENWGAWSECDLSSGFETRTRKCRGSRCVGRNVDQRPCSGPPISETTSNWTQWYKTENEKYRVSLRAKCPKNQFLSPVMEERQRVCIESCQDSALKWSVWSKCTDSNIQYRLFNCSSFELCPYTRTEVKSCLLTSRKLQASKEATGGTYTMIHLVLAILVASMFWLIILIIVSFLWIRYNRKNERKSKTRLTKSRRSYVPRYLEPFALIPQKSILSETSNEYLSSGMPSPQIDRHIPLFRGAIPCDRATQSSRDSYTFI